MQKITPAQKIKMLREQKDLTQEKLADALRVSVGTIKNWENGASEPSMSAVEDLAKLFKVSVVDIFGTTATLSDNDAIERIKNDSEINEMIQSNASESLKFAKNGLIVIPRKLLNRVLICLAFTMVMTKSATFGRYTVKSFTKDLTIQSQIYALLRNA